MALWFVIYYHKMENCSINKMISKNKSKDHTIYYERRCNIFNITLVKQLVHLTKKSYIVLKSERYFIVWVIFFYWSVVCLWWVKKHVSMHNSTFQCVGSLIFFFCFKNAIHVIFKMLTELLFEGSCYIVMVTWIHSLKARINWFNCFKD